MSRAISTKSLTIIASLAAAGIALAPLGALANPPGVGPSFSFGHPLSIDLHDQVRFPRIQGQILTDNPNAPGQNGGHAGGHNVPKWTPGPKH